VSYSGINDEIKQKVYKHHNCFLKEVKVILVSGFNNIDRKYEMGLNEPWSLSEFMSEQPNRKTLMYNLTRILRVSLIMFDNDATGCFHRIIVALAMIAAL
jgi:hypothetical protein